MPMQATTTQPLFAATLRPERSLRAAGGWLALVVAGIVGTPLLVAVPEFLLPGLTAYGLAGGGLMVFGIRQARRGQAYEKVTVWTDQLEIVSVTAAGAKTLRRFDPKTVRLKLDRDENERTQGLILVSGGEQRELGSFLSTDEKSSFAKAFGRALRQARRA